MSLRRTVLLYYLVGSKTVRGLQLVGWLALGCRASASASVTSESDKEQVAKEIVASLPTETERRGQTPTKQ